MKRRYFLSLLCGVTGLLLLPLVAAGQGSTLAAGTSAPDFSADAGGKTIRSSDYKGKILVLDFYATWNPATRKSAPHLASVYEKVKGQNVVVVGIAVKDKKADFDAWVKENGSKYGYTFAYPAGNDEGASVVGAYQVTGLPTTYVIDASGKVVEGVIGYTGDSDKRIERALEKAGVKVP
jgi:peroxiredoxin